MRIAACLFAGMVVHSFLLVGVITHQLPACTSGKMCFLGLSFTARAYTCRNGANHPSREGRPFLFAHVERRQQEAMNG